MVNFLDFACDIFFTSCVYVNFYPVRFANYYHAVYMSGGLYIVYLRRKSSFVLGTGHKL